MTGEMSVKHEMRLFPVRLLPALSLSLSPAGKTMENESVLMCVLCQLCELTSMASTKRVANHSQVSMFNNFAFGLRT